MTRPARAAAREIPAREVVVSRLSSRVRGWLETSLRRDTNDDGAAACVLFLTMVVVLFRAALLLIAALPVLRELLPDVVCDWETVVVVSWRVCRFQVMSNATPTAREPVRRAEVKKKIQVAGWCQAGMVSTE